MIMKINTILGLTLMSIFALQSCGSEAADTESNNVANNSHETVIVEEEESPDDQFTFVPPSPLQIASIFKKAGLEYDAALPNDANKAENYSESFTQSLNFGVYSSDLAYSVKSEKYDQASQYLSALKGLSGKIGLATVFEDQDLIDRFNNNIGNQDSIVDILIYVQENTDDYIAENGKVELSVVYYAGAWIEGMYFGANAAKANPSDLELGALMSEQMTIGKSIQKGLVTLNAGDADAQDLAGSIGEILDTFENFESVKSLGEDAAYLDIYLTEEEVGTIADMIIELRNSIVE